MFSIAAYEYHQNKIYMKVIRRTLRDNLDPFDMPDQRFIEMYRMPRCLALDFLNIVNVHMHHNVCPQIPMTVQFCSVLNFYSSGSYQRRVASDAFAMMSQTLVSRCVRSYSYIIATRIMDQFIQFPRSVNEIKRLHDELQQHTDFRGAFAIVDGSLIALAGVGNEIEHSFLSRKSFHAINTQFVIDVNMRFLSVNARYPGSTHDALIWRASMVNTFLRRISNRMGQNWSYFMLADNGYPLQPWLLKPYDSPQTPAERLYNKIHRKLRSLIERAIGLLKARFRCLLGENKLRYDPLMSGYIIYSCSVLHNFLIDNNYRIDDLDPIFEDEDGIFDEDLDDLDILCDELQGGMHVRNGVAQYLYYN